MEVCGLGGEGKNTAPGKSDAHSAEQAAAQRHSFWHSGLNTAVLPGSEPATEGAGEKIVTGVVGVKIGGKGREGARFPPYYGW